MGLDLSNNKIRKVLEKCYLCGEIGDLKILKNGDKESIEAEGVHLNRGGREIGYHTIGVVATD